MMKKHSLLRWIALLMTGALIISFAACGGEKNPPEKETTTEIETTTEPESEPVIGTESSIGVWQIEVRGVPGATSFTSELAQYLPKVEVEMTTTNSQGFTATSKYGGITLRSLLQAIGVYNVSFLTVTSIDNISATYPAAIAMAEDTILAWEIDGAQIDGDIPLRMCPKSGTAEMFVPRVSSITAVPAPVETTEFATDPTIETFGTVTWPPEQTYTQIVPSTPRTTTTKSTAPTTYTFPSDALGFTTVTYATDPSASTTTTTLSLPDPNATTSTTVPTTETSSTATTTTTTTTTTTATTTTTTTTSKYTYTNPNTQAPTKTRTSTTTTAAAAATSTTVGPVWECVFCGTLNFGHVTTCAVCKKVKGSQP